jgi:serine/threonine protein kinase
MNMAFTNEKMNFCGNDCDIFALGVTLFNLCIRARKESALHDYGKIARPFRIADAELFSIHASKDQHWYYLLQNGVTLDQKGVQRRVSPADMRQKFWSQHVPKVDFDVKYPQLADLLIGMMHPFAASRYNIANVRQHNWLTQGEQLDKAELKKEMDARRITLRTHI